MDKVVVLVVIGLLVWLYTSGYLLQALLCLAALIGAGVLHEKLGPSDKKLLYGIPLGCAVAFGLLLWLLGWPWYLFVGGPLLMLAASTVQWKSKGQRRLKIVAWVLLAAVVAGAFGLDLASKAQLKKDERIAGLEEAFLDNMGSASAEGFTFVKEPGDLTERYPAPYLFCWYNAADKDGNRDVRFNVNGASLGGYYLSEASVAGLKTVIIAVRHMTVSKGVVTQRSGGKNYGHYKHDYDYDLYFFNLDTKEWSELDFVKNGRPDEYRGVNCYKRDAVRYVKALYAGEGRD